MFNDATTYANRLFKEDGNYAKDGRFDWTTIPVGIVTASNVVPSIGNDWHSRPRPCNLIRLNDWYTINDVHHIVLIVGNNNVVLDNDNFLFVVHRNDLGN